MFIIISLNTEFWLDVWVGNQDSKEFLIYENPLVDLHIKVVDYWLPGEGWNWTMMEGFLRTEIEDKITTIILCEDDHLSNCISWSFDTSGLLTICYTYDTAIIDNRVRNIWKHI